VNQIACGAVNLYCPTGSSAAQPVGAGYYTTPNGPSTLVTQRTARSLAQPGSYASNGVLVTCPQGTYCAGLGLTTFTGYCDPGFYCPEAAQTNTGACANGTHISPQYYCLGGQVDGNVLTTDLGYYSIPEDAAPERRTGQVACEENELCSLGERLTRVDWLDGSLCSDTGDKTVTAIEFNRVDTSTGEAGDVLTSTSTGQDDAFAIRGLNNINHQHDDLTYRIDGASDFSLVNTAGSGRFLQTNNQLDYETLTSYSVVVIAEYTFESITYSASCTLQINIVNKNDIPELNGNFVATLSVDEHVDFGITLGPTLFANDADVANAELSYYIVQDYGDGSLGHFRISQCSGQLTVGVDGLTGIDFLTKSSYMLKIRVCDDGNAFNPAEPTRCSDGYDPDTNSYVIAGLDAVGQIVINVVDVNDAPVVTSLINADGATVSDLMISEDASGSTTARNLVVGSVRVADADIVTCGSTTCSSTSDIHQYSISDPTGTFNIVTCDRANNNLDCADAISDDGSSMSNWPAGTIYLNSAIDYEFWRAFAIQYTVTVVVQDRVGSADNLSGSTTFTIAIGNTNDSPTVTCPLGQESPCYRFYIAENVNMNDAVLLLNGGTDLATIEGEDEDERYETEDGYDSVLHYAISETSYVSIAGAIFTDAIPVSADIFALTTGAAGDPVGLKVNTLVYPVGFADVASGLSAGDDIFDFESITSIFVEVTVSDNGMPTEGTSTPKVVIVEVELTPVNEPPIIERGQAFTVSEASCIGGACTETDIVFPGYCLSNYAQYDPDNSNTGGNRNAVVQDTLFYSITEGFGSAYFSVVTSETGEPCLMLTLPVDFENGVCNTDCEIQITVADRQPASSGGEDVNVVVLVTIGDVDEPPTINPQQSFDVNENLAVGESEDVIVGTIVISDPDMGTGALDDQGNLLVSINADSTSGVDIFAIAPYDNSGGYRLSIKAGSVLNFENFLNSYEMTIDVVDKDASTLSVSAVVSVRIVNLNDAPVLSPQEFSFSQVNDPSVNSGPFTIGTVAAVDEDSSPVQSLVFVIVSQSLNGGASDATISVNPSATAELQVNCYTAMCTASAQLENQVYTLTMRVDDNGVVDDVEDHNPLSSTTAIITVRSTAQNDLPVAVNPVVTVPLDENTGAYTFTNNLDDWFIDQDMLTYTITQVTPSVIASVGDLPSVQIFANGDPAREWFQINDVGGNSALQLIANGGFLDFEGISGGSIDVTLEARDDVNAVVTMHLIVDVGDLNEMPKMKAQSREFNESPTPGGPLGSPLDAFDPDAIDTGALTWTITKTDGSPSELFTIESTTGQVSINVGEIDYETDAIQYELTAKVTDTVGQFAENVITITVLDVNESPALSVTDPSHCSINEATLIDTTLPQCAFTAIDQEVDDLTFTIDDVSLQSTFSVASNGEVTLLQELDFEAVGSYTFDLSVTDGVSTTTKSVTFTVGDSNDVPTPIVDANLLFMQTKGEQAVTLQSSTSIFGPLRTKAGFVDSNQEAGVGAAVSVVYGPATINGDGEVVIGEPKYTAQGCEIIWDGGGTSSTIECDTAPGVGSNLFWQVTIDGHSSAVSSSSTEYDAPSITLLLGDHQAIPTEGGSVVINGTNFGPADSSFELLLFYGQTVVGEDVDASTGYSSSACTVTIPHLQVTCAVPAGVGNSLHWQVQLGNKKTPTFPASGVASDSSYIAPAFTEIEGGSNLSTLGQGPVTLNGKNFGPVADFSKLLIYYGPVTGGVVEMKYYPSCSMTAPGHVEIQCLTTSGSGRDHQWVIVAAGLSSSPSVTLTHYIAPVLTSLSGAGALEARTIGGQLVVLRGENFGPLIDGATGNPSDISVTYGDDDTLQFTANECQVTDSSQTTISCLTGEGYGFDHQWVVSINGQSSNVLDADSSYGVPVVFNYDGVGASGSPTEGNAEVVIEGRNFGNADIAIEAVVYTSSDGTVFDATSTCSISEAHEKITCRTSPGAGTGLRWQVTIAGQNSEFPTTTYSDPIIYGIMSDPAATLGNSAGGDDIFIKGANFGPDTFNGEASTFLTSVTYGGFDGTRYQAVGCIVQSHTLIKCTTIAGVGQDHAWVVEVSSQFSELSTATCTEEVGYVCSTSYAMPTITSLEPGVGLTSGLTEVTILGTNFGVGASPPPQLSVFFDGQLIPATSSFDRGGGVQGLTFLAPECTCVTEFVGTCGTLVNGNAAYLCEKDREVKVAVDVETCAEDGSTVDGCTGTADFDYNEPKLNTVSAEDTGNPATFRLRVQGENFCSSSSCGELLVGETTYTVEQWSHTEITAIVPAQGNQVRVKVGARYSAGLSFMSISPILSSGSSDYFTDTLIPTEGVSTTIQGLYFGAAESEFAVTIGVCPTPINTVDCKVVETNSYTDLGDQTWSVAIVIPEGTGTGFPLKVWRDIDSSSGATVVNYAPPAITAIQATDGSEANMATAGGTMITVTGNNFGADFASASALLTGGNGGLENSGAVSCTGSHTMLTCTTPPGQGSDYDLRVIVNGQQSDVDNVLTKVSFAAPSVSSLSFVGGTFPTAGGGMIALVGDNFGIQALGPSVKLDVALCNECGITEERDCVVTSFSHTSVSCTLPSGQGTNLNIYVVVSQQYSTEQQGRSLLDLEKGGYDPPLLTTINAGTERIEIDTTGGTTVTLSGLNFGERRVTAANEEVLNPWTLVLEGGTLANGESASNVQILDDLTTADGINGDIISWDHTQVVFKIPEGQGPNKKIVMTVADQVSTFASGDLVISYLPPSVAEITGPYINTPVPESVAPNGRTTSGGYEIIIVGSNFGIANALVTVGGVCTGSGVVVCMEPVVLRSCTGTETNPGCIVSQSHNEVRIIMPRGTGAGLDMSIDVDGSTSSTAYSYDPPRLNGLSSKQIDANGGLELEIYGYNLGASTSQVNLLLDGIACDEAEWAETTTGPFIRCRSTPRLPVGFKDATLKVAFQESDITFTNFIEYLCLDGYYGADGENCVFCGNEIDTGYVCEDAYPIVNGDIYDTVPEALFNVESDLSRDQQEMLSRLIAFDRGNPFSAPGWWRDSVTPNRNGRCVDGLIPVGRDCPVMRPCEPQASCLGNNTCQGQYLPTSPRCSICNDNYFRLNGECAECPDHLWLIITAFVLAGLCGAYIAKKLREKNVNWTVISIGVDYFQVLAIFATTNVRWPDGIQDLYDSFSVFNLNLELLAPECWATVSVNYQDKWFSIMSLPLIMIGLSLFPFFGAVVYKRFVQGRRSELFNHVPTLISNILIIMYFMYLFITNTALAPFNCQATTPDDGKQYMQAVGTDAECGEDGGTQQTLVPWAIIFVMGYSVGFPAFVAFIIFRNQNNITIDQVNRAERTLPHIMKDENQDVWHFRKSFYILYYQYKPEYYWWIMVVLARKACISIAALIFRKNTIFQLCVILLVMFCAYAMQVRHQPFMAVENYEDVIEKYKKLTRRDSLRGRKNKAHAALHLGGEGDAVTATTFNGQNAKSFLFNYNTVESVLLFCAVLVNLSGIMFESGQLANGSSNDALAYLVIVMVSLSITYFAFVVSAELLFAFYPDCWLFQKDKEQEEFEGTEFENHNPLMVGSQKEDLLAEEHLGEDNSDPAADLQEMQDIIQSQKDEIKALQQQMASDNLTKGLGFTSTKKSEKKKKKKFGKGGNTIEMASQPTTSSVTGQDVI